jgi:hypothetical protein
MKIPCQKAKVNSCDIFSGFSFFMSLDHGLLVARCPRIFSERLYVSIGKGGNPRGRISRIGVNHIANGYPAKS